MMFAARVIVALWYRTAVGIFQEKPRAFAAAARGEMF
jgi:hypothetical protein